MVRKYWYWESGCPQKPDCSASAWQKAKKWSLASADHCAQNLIDHLKTSGCHYLSDARAREEVDKHRHKITQHTETWEEREQAREYERQKQAEAKAKDQTRKAEKEKEHAAKAKAKAAKEEARSSASKEEARSSASKEESRSSASAPTQRRMPKPPDSVPPKHVLLGTRTKSPPKATDRHHSVPDREARGVDPERRHSSPRRSPRRSSRRSPRRSERRTERHDQSRSRSRRTASMSADQDDVSTSKVASALKQLTDVVTTLVDPKAKAAASGSSRFSIVPSAPEPQALAIPGSDEILSVTLTGAEIAEVAMSVCRVKNAAKHLKSNVAERLEKNCQGVKGSCRRRDLEHHRDPGNDQRDHHGCTSPGPRKSR